MLQIALLYRSPSVSMATLITVVSRLLAHVSVSNIPCLILGDFNEDLLHQHQSTLLAVMSNHGFSQLVQCPTMTQFIAVYAFTNKILSCCCYYKQHSV